MNTKLTTIGAVGALLAGGAITAISVGAADHLDAPLVQEDGRTDINDVYVFQSPSNPDNTVLIMTVNPGAGVISGTDYSPDATYQFFIDKDGDARQDQTYTVQFANAAMGQRVSVADTNGGLKPGTLDRGPVGTTLALSNGGQIATGVYDDPFFFDLVGFNNGFAFTGDDFFAGLDVSAIVLEVPTSEIGAPGDNIAVWAGTRDSTTRAAIDQMGRPGISTVLIAGGMKDDFNKVAPHRQFEVFGDDVAATIASLNGGDTATAGAIAAILLPDVNTFELGLSAGFLNGRQLADDVIDAELGLLTNGALTTDGVDSNDVAFSDVFPYLAPVNSGS